MKISREAGIGATILFVIVLGLALDAFAPEASPATNEAATGPRFVERALFCPGPLEEVRSFAIAATRGGDRVSLGLEPARPDRVELGADRLFTQELPGSAATDVVGYGTSVVAGSLMRSSGPVEGEGSARCSERASSHWFFAAGSSTLGVDEHLLIYNPFPDEAVVRVTFMTSGGEDRKGGLADVPVPAKSSTVIRVNEFIRLERSLGVRIDTKRGRVVAWKLLFDKPEGGPSGSQLSLGAPATSDTWFFPEGLVGPAAEERIGLINPSREEASVTVSLSSGGELIQPPELVEIALPPGSSRALNLAEILTGRQKELGGVSAVVQSTNGVGVVAERSLRYSGRFSGSTSETGAPRPAQTWLLPVASLRPEGDSVVVMNPGSAVASIGLSLIFEDRGLLEPASIQDRELPPGGRLRIGILPWTEGRTVMVRVTSSQPVVAERVSYSDSDAASVIGFPLQ